MYPIGPAAYDRAITVFSPDGRLFQVEYAREAVKRGTTACGIVYENGVLLAVDRSTTSPLLVPKSMEKIFKVDEHIGIATSGLVADARRLIEDARLRAQRNRLAYKEPISVPTLTREICDMKQIYTQFGGARPFGAALLIAGVNEEAYLFETDPSGAFTQYKAAAIGMGKADVEKLFHENWKDTPIKKDAIALILRGLNLVSEEEIRAENIEIITVDIDSKYKKVGVKEIQELLSTLGGEFDSDKKKTLE